MNDIKEWADTTSYSRRQWRRQNLLRDAQRKITAIVTAPKARSINE